MDGTDASLGLLRHLAKYRASAISCRHWRNFRPPPGAAHWTAPCAAAAAQARGIGVQPLSGFALAPRPEDNGLVLGYGNTPAERFDSLVRQLARLLPPGA